MNVKLFLYRTKEKFKRRWFLNTQGYCTVLLYHRVVDLNYDPQLLCVSLKNFEDQLRFLKKKGKFLTLEEFTEILSRKGKFPKNSFLITFDDGYLDNYTNALPVLEKLGLQAVFYIATNNINTTNLFWWDELDLIFRKVRENRISLNHFLTRHKVESLDELYKFYIHACKTVKHLSEREELMNEVRSFSPLAESDKKDYAFLTETDIKKIDGSRSAVIAAHTVNHLSLGHLTKQDQQYEITESVKTLEEITKHKIEHFSFPYGEKIHFNSDTVSICRDLKLKSSAANYLDIVTNKDSVFSFPRFVVRNDSPEILYNKIKAAVK